MAFDSLFFRVVYNRQRDRYAVLSHHFAKPRFLLTVALMLGSIAIINAEPMVQSSRDSPGTKLVTRTNPTITDSASRASKTVQPPTALTPGPNDQADNIPVESVARTSNPVVAGDLSG